VSYSVILPTFNEEGHIVNLIKEIQNVFKKLKCKYEIIIIDDNSTDKTQINIKKNFSSNFIKLFIRKKKRSLVSSINEGILKSSNNYIIWMDADFQHPPVYIKKFIKLSKTNDAIIFSRFLNNSKRFYNDIDKKKNTNTIFSNFLNKLGNFILYEDITDYTSGFICVKKKLLKKKLVGHYGDYFMYLIYELKKNKVRIQELAFAEQMRKTGKSKTTAGLLSYAVKLYYYTLAFFIIFVKKNFYSE
jgi:glycosyltransferase involved in cell wall biosynthesis